MAGLNKDNIFASRLCKTQTSGKWDPDSTRFIATVQQEDRHDKLLQMAYEESSAENRYGKNLRASIALCTALQETKRRQFVERMRELADRRRSPDIRELEKNIRAAYTSKAVQVQSFEQNALINARKFVYHNSNRILNRAHYTKSEFMANQEHAKKAEYQTLRKFLDEQIYVKNVERQEEIDMKLEEQERMRIWRENEKKLLEEEARQTLERKRKTQQDIDKFKDDVRKYKESNKEKEGVKYCSIMEALDFGRQRSTKAIKGMILQREKIANNVGTAVLQKTMHEVSETNNLIDLLVDERIVMEEIKDHESKKEAMRKRIEWGNEIEAQLKQKEAQIEQENIYADKVYQEFLHECDKLNQKHSAREEQKRLAKTKYQQELKDAFHQTSRMRVAFLNREMQNQKRELERIKEEEKRTQELREKLLNQYLSNLEGYMPTHKLIKHD